MSDDRQRPTLRWRTLAGFLILLAGIGFFLLNALVPLQNDISPAAWALLTAACLFFFGINIHDTAPTALRTIWRMLSKQDDPPHE